MRQHLIWQVGFRTVEAKEADCECWVWPQNAEEDQCGQRRLEHQGRRGIDKGPVDPAEFAQTQADEHHRENREYGFQCLEEQVDQGHGGTGAAFGGC